MIARRILDKVDRKVAEANSEPNPKKAGAKAFVAGMMEGAIDGVIIMYPIVLASAYYWQHKALKK